MTWDWVIWLYLASVFLLGVLAVRYVKDFGDFIYGGGRLGLLLLGGTVVATQWGGVTFLGIAGFSYENLYQGVWYALGPSVRFLFWAFLLAVAIRKVQPYTVSEWFALRYDNKNGVVSSILNAVTGLGLLGAQFVAFGAIASQFFGWDLTSGIVIGAVIVIVYTVAGGFFAVAYTDTLQSFLALAGGVAVVIGSIRTFGSMADVRQELPTEYFDPAEPWGFLFMLTIFMLWLADLPLQNNVQRMSGARNVKTAYWAAIIGGLSYVLVFYVTPALGAYARLAQPDLESPDAAYPALIQAVLPTGVAAFVAASLLAVVMSSADSYLSAPASVLTNDLYRVWRPGSSQTEILWVTRGFTLAFAVLAILAALAFQVIIELILTFLTIGWAMLPAYFAFTMWRGPAPTRPLPACWSVPA